MSIELNSLNFEKEVVAHQGNVLVDFYTQTCSPCRMMAPILEEIAKEVTDLKVAKVDAAEDGQLAARFRVSAVPTFVLFKNGQASKQFVGMKSKKDLLTWINS
ncbi:MAG: Thioredoxin [Verrucomicrobiales bacterium]|nr:Thioredoxin [Verrucomicrobiales bacterium]